MRTPTQIQRFLDDNAHRMDLSVQYLGTEPNAIRKPWDDTTVRWCLMASWTYEQAAGNSSIPAVYKAINTGRADYLCDRFYLPNTPRDLRLLEKNRIPVFGIESKHPLTDFDVAGTSISYPVLAMSFVKMLTMSGIPARWRERQDQGLENYPMVIVGGQCYGAPEVLAPVVDCWWLGEVEDEPGNPGISALGARIAAFKTTGRWTTDRLGCYEDLARTFRHLYFPRFVDLHYAYQDRTAVGVGPLPSKQVVGYSANLDGMRMPLVKRYVKNLDNAAPLDDPPLLYTDPAMGSGDLEVARGCPAWCSFCSLCLSGDTRLITRDGVRTLKEVCRQKVQVWTSAGWQDAEVDRYGTATLNRITFVPADFGGFGPRPSISVVHEATALHRWPLVDGTETHHLKVGDFVRAEFVREVSDPDVVDRGFVHGFVFGDGSEERSTRQGRVYKVGLFGAKDAAYAPRFARYLRPDLKYGREPVSGIAVLRLSEPKPSGKNGVLRAEVRLVTDISMKEFPVDSASPDYIRGFLEGWLAADGSSSDGPQSIELASQHPNARAWLDRHASYAGWVLNGAAPDSCLETNFMRRKAPLGRYTLTRGSAAWKVVAIDEGQQPQPVYCATVPGEGFFTLASGVYTGNTYRQKPYRQRSVANVVDYAKRFADNMGSVRVAPFSPDFPMYTRRKELIARLLAEVSDEVDAPTMRVDDFIADNDFILLQVHGGMDAVTLGVEGNSQRMRDLVGKGTSDAEIKEAVTRGIRAGIRKIKLFMISNLPGEDEGDVLRILKLAKDLADIRESMNQPTVRIQFSWTPLLVEANTPMQWFAPTVGNRILGDMWEEFRDLKIDFKIGAKAEPNKLAFFQLCQRASRDVGEALVDAMLDIDQATWGGFPRTFKALLEDKLLAHGFHNGFVDCFDERDRTDMFGWEMIDQGINVDMLWTAYLQMREFVEQTDSRTYDTQVGPDYHGNEWLVRCDERCYGRSCGVCDYTDLKIRKRYLEDGASDTDIDLSTLALLDQRTQAMRIRARVDKPTRYRFVGNDHWRFAVRRAAFRAQAALGWEHGIAKRSIRFASDEVRHRDWTSGVDYVEFAFVRPHNADEVDAFLTAMNTELGEWLHIGAWTSHPTHATTLRADVDLSLFELEVHDQLPAITTKLAEWRDAPAVPMRLKVEGGYFAPATEEVDAKRYVDDLWLTRDGHRLLLRMLVRGRPNPYNVYVALMGRTSWLEDAKTPARRLDVFTHIDRRQQDFLRPTCTACGLQILVNILDEPWHPQMCPRCKDEHPTQGATMPETTDPTGDAAHATVELRAAGHRGGPDTPPTEGAPDEETQKLALVNSSTDEELRGVNQ